MTDNTDPMTASLIEKRTLTLTQMSAIDTQLGEVAGTQSAKVKRITDALVADAPTLDYDEYGSAAEDVTDEVSSLVRNVSTKVSPVTARLMLDKILVDLSTVRDEVDAEMKALVSNEMRRTGAANENVTALKTARTTLVTQVDAFNKVLASFGVESVDIPQAPRISSGTSAASSGRPVKVKDVEYYRLVNGVETFYSTSRDLSLIALNYGVNVGDLANLLRESGVESVTQPFCQEVKVTATKGAKVGTTRTVTIGCKTTDK